MSHKYRNHLLAVTGVIFLVALIIAMRIGGKINEGRTRSVNLAGDWTLSLPNEEKKGLASTSIKIPTQDTSFVQSHMPDYTGWMKFTKEIEIPKICKAPNKGCNLLIGEVGDALVLSINGVSVGTHGGLPPNYVYKKNHPVNIFISSDIFARSNKNTATFEITSYSPKLAQIGIRSAPLGLYDSSTADTLATLQTVRNVVLPFAIGFLMLLIAVITLIFNMKTANPDKDIWAFLYYCVITGFYLLSFTEFPREMFDLTLVGFIHFTLRTSMDWSLFYLATAFVSVPALLKKSINYTYLSALIVYLFVGLGELTGAYHLWGRSGFDSAFILMRWFALLALLPYATGAFFRPLSPYFDSKLIKWVFRVAVVLNLQDVLIFHQLVNAQYNVKLYPILFGGAFGWFFLQKYFDQRIRLMTAANEREVFRQIAHDIKSPLAALASVSRNLKSIDEGSRELVRRSTERITDIANDLLRKGSRLQNMVAEETRAHLLWTLVEEIISEKRAAMMNKGGIEIRLINEAPFEFARVKASEFKRAFSNILNNAVESFDENRKGRVFITIQRIGSRVLVEVSDNGRGMSSETVHRLGQKGFTQGKVNGSGAGFSYAKETVERFGGRILVNSQRLKGTTVVLELLSSATPQWFAKSLVLSPTTRIVALDDDNSIHAVWDSRFAAILDEPVIHLSSAKEFSEYIENNKFSDCPTLFLIDHELSLDGLNGIEIIEKYSLTGSAVLVTSRFQDELLMTAVEDLKIKVLPKILASNIQVISSGAEKWILVDDDSLVRQMWSMSARDSFISLETFSEVDSFIGRIETFPLNSRFYIDANICGKHDGVALAADLMQRGYRFVTVSTGEDYESLDLPDGVSYTGKIPPWAALNASVAI